MSCPRGCCPTERDHYRSIQFSGQPSPASVQESGWEKDMPAYKRLRANGIQPKSIDGAAALEAGAESKHEITAGQLLDKRQRAQLKKVMGNDYDA